MKNPIDVSSPYDVLIVDEDWVVGVGYYKCQNTTTCNRPYHYMVELRSGKSIEVTLEKFVQVTTQLNVQKFITLPENYTGATSVGVQ